MFKYEGWMWKIGDYAFKAFVIGILWILGSLPIITIGTASTAAYFTGIKLAENDDIKIIPTFWRSYKSNLVQSILLFIPFLLMGCSMIYFYGNTYYFTQLENGVATWYLILTIIIFILTLNVFPILSKFEMKSLQIFKLSIVFSFTHIGLILQAVFIFLLAVFVFIAMPYYAMFAVGVYFIATGRFYHHAFNQIIENQKRKEEELSLSTSEAV